MYFNSIFARRGAGLQAGAGATERWGLWRRPVELWKLHLPQPPCTQPLWTVWDATLHLKLALRCIAHPCLILHKSLDTMSPIPIDSVLRSSPVSQYISPCYLLRKSQYHPPTHSSISRQLLLCTIISFLWWMETLLMANISEWTWHSATVALSGTGFRTVKAV